MIKLMYPDHIHKRLHVADNDPAAHCTVSGQRCVDWMLACVTERECTFCVTSTLRTLPTGQCSVSRAGSAAIRIFFVKIMLHQATKLVNCMHLYRKFIIKFIDIQQHPGMHGKPQHQGGT